MRSALATVESRCAITSTVKSFIILSRASWTTASLSESKALVACMWCGVIRCQTADSQDSSTQLPLVRDSVRRDWSSITKYCLAHPRGKRGQSPHLTTAQWASSRAPLLWLCAASVPRTATPPSPRNPACSIHFLLQPAHAV